MKNPTATVLARLLIVLAALWLPNATVADDVDKMPAATDVLKKYADACGGVAKLKALKTVKMTGRVKAPGMEGTFTSVRQIPNMVVNKAEIPQIGSQAEGYDGKIGWENSSVTGPRIVDGVELAQMADEVNLARIYDPASFYKEIKLIGMEDRSGEKCYKLKLKLKNDRTQTEFYSVKTGLMVGRDKTMLTQLGDMFVERNVKAYKEVAGVKLESEYEEKYPTGTLVTIIFDEMIGNVDLPAGTFDLPGEIKTLIDQQGDKNPVDSAKANDSVGKAGADDSKQLVNKAVARLVELQHEDGAWPYGQYAS